MFKYYHYRISRLEVIANIKKFGPPILQAILSNLIESFTPYWTGAPAHRISKYNHQIAEHHRKSSEPSAGNKLSKTQTSIGSNKIWMPRAIGQDSTVIIANRHLLICRWFSQEASNYLPNDKVDGDANGKVCSHLFEKRNLWGLHVNIFNVSGRCPNARDNAHVEADRDEKIQDSCTMHPAQFYRDRIGTFCEKGCRIGTRVKVGRETLRASRY